VTNFQPNPENFQPDIAARDTPERPFVPVEYYAKDQIARDILDSSDETYTDETSGEEKTRAIWEDDSTQYKYYLWSYHCNERDQCEHYVMDANSLTSSESTRYTFGGMLPTKIELNDGSTISSTPTDETVNDHIKRVLLRRHSQTQRGKEADEGYSETFNMIIGTSAVKFVLKQNVSLLLTEARASDREIQNRAYEELYRLSLATGFQTDQRTFRTALQNEFYKHHHYAFENVETAPLPRIVEPRPYPDFERAAQPRSRRNVFRKFPFFRR
jgi:hypothetical protein